MELWHSLTPNKQSLKLSALIILLTSTGLNSLAQVTCTPPNAAISLVAPAICQGGSAYLKLNSATGQGPYTLTVNGSTYSNISVGENFGPFDAGETTVWKSSDIPGNPAFVDGQALEVGTKIRSTINGYITGIRFYKGPANTGLHTGTLWSSSGALLARGDFMSETASGWQTLHFSTPVAITANTTYIVSYFSPNGVYALNTNYFAATSATNANLSALATGIDGGNGVFKYGGGFPATSYLSSNYWVDAIFTPTLGASSTSYVLTSISDANSCSNTGTLSTATLTVNPLPAGTLTAAQGVCEGQQINLNFNANAGTGPFSIITNSITNNNVTSNLPFATTINASNPNTTPVSIWSSAPVTGIVPVVNDDATVELGVKFKSSITGSITGIRFYKRVENTGTHTGSLWTSTGTLLATATFTAESASGWQTVMFPFPIAITANQVFIASYLAPVGQYAYSQNYFNGYTATNGSLSAPQTNPTDGGNGVFKYGGGFPNTAFNNNNYWVDVIFTGSQGNNLINMTQITDANGCSTVGTPIQALNIPTTACVPLPVTLVDFRVSTHDKNILLSWETASENNNKGFEVQRSTNGTSWSAVGFVKGAGTSGNSRQYAYTDADLPAGRYYYRLRQIDLDEKYKFSAVLSAELKGGPENFLGQNYPNPVAGTTIINYSLRQPAPVTIALYDISGRQLKLFVNENKTAGKYAVTADLHSLLPGTYYYRMNAGSYSETKKLVIGNR